MINWYINLANYVFAQYLRRENGEIGLRHYDRYRPPAFDSPGYDGALSVG